MMSEAPAVKRLIDRAELDDRRYFESLLETALERGAIDAGFIQRLQYSLVSALSDKCRRYTQGDSSSVPVETAEELLRSMIFTLGVWLKRAPEPDGALDALLREGVNTGLEKGLKAIRTMTEAAKTFYMLVKARRAPTDNYAYNSTLDGGIAGFFKLYEPEFGAHKIHITADYPVMLYPDGFSGIEFITAYLQRLQYENLFVSAFPEAAVKRLIALYSIACGETTRDIIMNIFEITLAGALACVLAGEGSARLSLTSGGARRAIEAISHDGFSLCAPLRCALASIGREDDRVSRYASAVCDTESEGILRAIRLIAEG